MSHSHRSTLTSSLWVCVATLFAVLPSPIDAQEAPTTISFRRYSVDEGLPQSGVSSIAQDDRGFLWLATQDGLSRFDGASFKTFRHDPDDPNSLPSDLTTAVTVDLEGNLWVASSAGVHRAPVVRKGRELDLRDTSISDRAATEERLVFEPPPVDSTQAPGQFQPSREMHLDSLGRVWMRAGDLAAVWDPRHGRLRQTTTDSATARPPPEAVLHHLREVLGPAVVDVWIQDRNGVFWLGQKVPWALIRYDSTSGAVDVFRHDPTALETIGDGEIFAIFEDSWGGLWVGTGRGGLNRILEEGDAFSHLGNVPGSEPMLPSNYITGISATRDGGLWIGTDNGLQELLPTGARGDAYSGGGDGSGPLADAYVRAVVTGPSGTVYVGAGDVLHALDPAARSWLRIKPDHGGLFMTAALDLDVRGHVWASFLLPDGSVVVQAIDDATGAWATRHELIGPPRDRSLSSNLVQSILVASDGLVWVGTWELGLYTLDPETGQVSHFVRVDRDPTSLPHNTVQVIAEDRRGRIWLGTRGGGLAQYDSERDGFTVRSTAHGLANNVVYGILEDDDGFLWISSNQGLSRYDTDSGAFSNFDVDDGLQSNEFNRWAFARETAGALVFGGINGISRFDPASISPRVAPPRVGLEALSVDNQPIAHGKDAASLSHVTLAHDQNLLTFEYIGVHPTHADQVRYAYRLDGIEDDWVDAGSRRIVSYANLAPGEYTFSVRAATGTGEWSETPNLLGLRILPPFWRTWWFLALTTTAGVGLLTLAHRYRLATLLREEQIRTRIARDLHDDVSATLSSVAYFAEAIRNDPAGSDTAKAERLLALISRSAGEAKDRIGDIIWAINPEDQSWESLLARIRRYTSDALDSHGMTHTIVLPRTILSKPLPPDRKQHLWLIIKEMITNTTRHSQCSHVDMSLTARGRTIRLSVADDGIGFDLETDRTGNGVSNIFERAKELNGQIELTTRANRGVRWDLTFDA